MKKKEVDFLVKLTWLLIAPLVIFTLGCGSGGTDPSPPDTAIFISASIDDLGDFIEVEMIKEITTDTATVSVTAGTRLPGVTTSVATVRLERYEVSFVREDGGSPGVSPVTGTIDQTVTIPGQTGQANVPTLVQFEIVVFPTSEKTFSDFAQAFAASLSPVTFNCTLKVFGRNLAGDTVEDTIGFKVQAAVFQPIDSLLPVITRLNESTSLNTGDNYFASWTTANRVDAGTFILPWGNDLFLGAGFFPIGSLTANTGFLEESIPPGTSRDFPSGVLIVSNPFGSAEAAASGGTNPVRIGTPAIPPPDPVTILEFFADRTTILLGESVNLNWSIAGGADLLEILPDTYSGVPADFSGKDPAFDAITIAPDFSVRPILKATRTADGVFDQEFLREPITVTQVVDPSVPANIEFFQASNTTVRVGRQTVFFWEVTGGVEKVELFPINGQRVDVSDRNSFLSPPLNQVGLQTFSLVAFSLDDSIDKRDITINVIADDNQPIAIRDIVQEPGTAINNDDEGSFRFTVSDPERQDSSWRVRKIAGDSVSFLPRDGKIPNGLGDASVSFDDRADNTNGFVTFEISAFDDDLFGFTADSTRAVQLVTFTTNGAISDNAPVITRAEFVPAGDPDLVPGSEGVINFEFNDPDTLSLRWQVSIVAGDFGGFLSRGSGTVSTGSGEISVRYEDDPDTPTEPVVFLIQVVESGTSNPQSDIFVLRVDKGPTPVTGPGSGSDDPIGFAFKGFFNNLFGGVAEVDVIPEFILYLDNSDPANPRFFRNSDLSGEVIGASAVYDLRHETDDPSQITAVSFTRDFISPLGHMDNFGILDFRGYFLDPGVEAVPSPTPITGGVARWFMPFSAEDFRAMAGDPFNLPAAGTMLYEIIVSAGDTSGNTIADVQTLRIIVP